MTPDERERGRRAAYRLFARLYREGVRPDVLGAVRGVPGLSEFVVSPLEEDAAAAEHYDVFGMNVFPFASAFLDPEGRLGGDAAEEAREWGERLGAAFDPPSEGPDHIASELNLLAGAGSEATQEVIGAFVGRHLVPWLLPFVCALERVSSPFYAALGRLTLDLVADHLRALGGSALPPVLPQEEAGWLGRRETGLRDVAAFLATPAHSGLWLSKTDLRVLGRSRGLPGGFGTRVDVLTNLLRSSAEYDAQEALVGDLLRHVAEHDTFYEHVTREHPVVAPVCAAWRERLAATRRVIAELRTGVGG